MATSLEDFAPALQLLQRHAKVHAEVHAKVRFRFSIAHIKARRILVKKINRILTGVESIISADLSRAAKADVLPIAVTMKAQLVEFSKAYSILEDAGFLGSSKVKKIAAHCLSRMFEAECKLRHLADE